MRTQDWWTGVTGKVKRTIVPSSSSSKSRSSKHRSSRHSRHHDSRRSTVRLPGASNGSNGNGNLTTQSTDGEEEGRSSSSFRPAQQRGYGDGNRTAGEMTEGSVDGYETESSGPYRAGAATSGDEDTNNAQSRRTTEYAQVRSNGRAPTEDESDGGASNNNGSGTNGMLTNGKRQTRGD
jgi:hypothetical protein